MKERKSLLKEIKRLLSKGMSNNYLEVTIKKKRHTRNFDFLGLKNLSPGQFLESFNLRRYH